MSFPDKPVHRFHGTVVQVTAHRMNVFGIGHPVEEHHGNIVILHLFKMLDVCGAAGDGSEDAIDPVVLHGFHQFLFAGQVVVALADQYNIIMIERYIFNAIDGGRKKILPAGWEAPVRWVNVFRCLKKMAV